MHHRILIKVKGESADEAKEAVTDILNGTLRCGTCEKGLWDYLEGVTHISKESLTRLRNKKGSTWEHDTPEEMAKDLIEKRQKDMANLKQRLTEELLSITHAAMMSTKDAPLFADIDLEKTKDQPERSITYHKSLMAKHMLKSGIKRDTPQTPEELAEALSDAFNLGSLGMHKYYMKKIEDLNKVLDFGDSDEGLYTLYCTENHYADMTEYTEGKNEYYFWCDRHY